MPMISPDYYARYKLWMDGPTHRLLLERGWNHADWADAALCYEKMVDGKLYVLSSIYNGLYGPRALRSPTERWGDFDLSLVYVQTCHTDELNYGTYAGEIGCEGVPLLLALAYVEDVAACCHC